VLEFHRTDATYQRARLFDERQQTGVLHTVLTAHLLYEELRVGADVQAADVVLIGPPERRDQAAVLRHVVGADAEWLFQFDDRPIVALDVHAVPGGAGIAARSAVDVRDRGRVLFLLKERRLARHASPGD